MPDLDAFGRPIPAAGTAPAPALTADPADAGPRQIAAPSGPGLGAPALAPKTYGMTRDRRFPWRTRFFFVLIAVTVSVAGILVATISHHAVSSFSHDTAPAAPAPVGLAHGSLLLKANLSAALDAIHRQAAGGEPKLVRVAPGRVDVQVRTPNGGLRNIEQTWNTPAKVVSDTAGGGTPSPLRWSQIDTAAPSRIAAAMTRGSTRPGRQVDYVVQLAGIPGWTAVRADGTEYTTMLDGAALTRVDG